jgi:hypothetical protein
MPLGFFHVKKLNISATSISYDPPQKLGEILIQSAAQTCASGYQRCLRKM